jgi:cytochrome c oxidase subunit II
VPMATRPRSQIWLAPYLHGTRTVSSARRYWGEARSHCGEPQAFAVRPATVPKSILVAFLPLLPWVVSCSGPLSALDPAGKDASTIATLWWWMFAGGLLVWLFVSALAVYGVISSEHDRKRTTLFVIVGGAVFPATVLTVLLIFGLTRVPAILAPGDSDAPVVRIIGEQWWWRVEYQLSDDRRFELANELRLPVGKRTSLELLSSDVIHSLWVPSLAGKVDLIPGRRNTLAFEPTRTGIFGGNCAEYCGLSHAKMLLHVLVLESEEFQHWAETQMAPSSSVAGKLPGAEVFTRHGCGACHTVRGTDARGRVGPDLTHVGGRHRLAAGILPNNLSGFSEWLRHVGALKPGAHMPTFDMLSTEDVEALASYLDSLK